MQSPVKERVVEHLSREGVLEYEGGIREKAPLVQELRILEGGEVPEKLLLGKLHDRFDEPVTELPLDKGTHLERLLCPFRQGIHTRHDDVLDGGGDADTLEFLRDAVNVVLPLDEAETLETEQALREGEGVLRDIRGARLSHLLHSGSQVHRVPDGREVHP